MIPIQVTKPSPVSEAYPWLCLARSDHCRTAPAGSRSSFICRASSSMHLARLSSFAVRLFVFVHYLDAIFVLFLCGTCDDTKSYAAWHRRPAVNLLTSQAHQLLTAASDTTHCTIAGEACLRDRRVRRIDITSERSGTYTEGTARLPSRCQWSTLSGV